MPPTCHPLLLSFRPLLLLSTCPPLLARPLTLGTAASPPSATEGRLKMSRLRCRKSCPCTRARRRCSRLRSSSDACATRRCRRSSCRLRARRPAASSGGGSGKLQTRLTVGRGTGSESSRPSGATDRDSSVITNHHSGHPSTDMGSKSEEYMGDSARARRVAGGREAANFKNNVTAPLLARAWGWVVQNI